MSDSSSEVYWNKGRISILGRDTPEKGKSLSSAKELMCCAPSLGGALEITLSHPLTAAYLRKNTRKQSEYMRSIFRDVCAAIPLEQHEASECYTELTMKGQVHVHGWLKLKDSYRHYAIGLVSDAAKACLEQYPKKYSKFDTNHIFEQWTNYCAPQCKIQYRYANVPSDMERFEEWKGYCKKLQ